MVDFTRYIPPNLREPLRQAGGLGYSLIDNIIGIDDDFESGGERFGRAVRENPVGTARAVGGGILNSLSNAVTDPVGTAQGVASDIGQSYLRSSQGAAAYLPEGVELADATYQQIRAANDAYLADITGLASVIPAGRLTGTAVKAADDAIGADARGLIRAVAQGDLEGVGEVFQRGREPKPLSADIKKQPVRGYDPKLIEELEANIGLRDEKGRAKPEALEALASQFDASGNRISNIRPDPKTGLTYAHPASNVKMGTPIEEQDVIKKIRGEAQKRRNTKLKVGDALVAAFGDRVAADTDILGYGGEMLSNPVSLYGGSGYIRDAKNRMIWASDENVTSPLLLAMIRAAEEGYNPRMIYTAMGAQASDFATDQLVRDYIRNIDIDPALRKELAKKLIASKDFKDKDFPYDLLISGGNSRRNMRGLLDGVEDYFDNLTGSNRRAVWQALDNATFRDAGIKIGEARLAQTDPDLMFANPFDSGLNIGSPSLNRKITNKSYHPIYPTAIAGRYDGSLPVQVPAAITFRDFFNMRRGLLDGFDATQPASDQRSFLMSHKNIVQPVDQQMVDELGLYNEFWRMFNK